MFIWLFFNNNNNWNTSIVPFFKLVFRYPRNKINNRMYRILSYLTSRLLKYVVILLSKTGITTELKYWHQYKHRFEVILFTLFKEMFDGVWLLLLIVIILTHVQWKIHNIWNIISEFCKKKKKILLSRRGANNVFLGIYRCRLCPMSPEISLF